MKAPPRTCASHFHIFGPYNKIAPLGWHNLV